MTAAKVSSLGSYLAFEFELWSIDTTNTLSSVQVYEYNYKSVSRGRKIASDHELQVGSVVLIIFFY